MAPVRATRWLGPSGGPLVFRCDDVYGSEPIARVFGSSSEEALTRRISAQADGAFEIIPVRFGRTLFYLALRGFRILRGEEQKRSTGSAARYLAECNLGDHGFLVQFLPVESETSIHAHGKKEETFWRILGLPYLQLGSPRPGVGLRERELEQSLFVPAGEFHQVITSEYPALTLIGISGEDSLGMSDYIRP